MGLTNTFEEIDGIRYPVYELKFQHAIEPASIIFSDGKGGEVGKTQTENLAFENNHKYQLIIKPQLYNVNIAEIENGSVIADPTQAEAGATIKLTARPDEGYELDGEIMVTCAHEDRVIPVENGTFVMPADDVTVNATFKKQGGDEPTETSYTIKFKDSGNDSDNSTKRTTIAEIISEGADYVSAINNPTNVYNARIGRGLKLGTSKANGEFAIVLKEKVKPTKITFKAMWYKSGEQGIKSIMMVIQKFPRF